MNDGYEQFNEENAKKKNKKKAKTLASDYNPLTIPPDWDLAKNHAKSRATKREYDNVNNEIEEVCPCCGYEVNRVEIGYCEPTISLGFLGSGYPLFYNFLFYCIMLLGVLFVFSGIFNVVTNSEGTFCKDFTKIANAEKIKDKCTLNWITKFSLANKKDNIHLNKLQNLLNLITTLVILVVLGVFRRSQRKLNSRVDESLQTPKDYSIMIKNIPTEMPNYNYREEIEKLLCKDKEREIKGFHYIFKLHELEHLEKEVKSMIKRKQETLRNNSLNFEDEAVKKIDEEIHEKHHEVEKKKEEYLEFPAQYFSGIVIVSFQTEQEKNEVIERQKVSFKERYYGWRNNGKFEKKEGDERIYINDSLLYIEEAPEPNEVDWEFIHYSTTEKIKARIKTSCLIVLLFLTCFGIIMLLTFFQENLNQKSEELEKTDKKKAAHFSVIVKVYSAIIGILIVLFNKFCLGKILHIIIDKDLHSTKTKFNLSFGRAFAIGMFFNTALITFFVEIIAFKNYYGKGGMIFTEYIVFILNSIFPPTVWLLDPWSIKKNYYKRKYAGKTCELTQEEANEIMESPDYSMAKRYADIMKTVLFTFFYASVLPLGVLWSMCGLTYYYFIDKYNILRRRTIKESISLAITLEMIEMIELTIPLFGLGNVVFNLNLFHHIDIYSITSLVIGLIYMFCPMEAINEVLFPIHGRDEISTYDEAKIEFDTVKNYDRENPITKEKAIKEYAELRAKGNNDNIF